MFLKYLCEFLGTMMLILLGDGVVANVTLNKSGMKGAGSIQITIAWGLAVMVPAFIFGEASGASFNPALTIALAVGGMFDWAGSLVAGDCGQREPRKVARVAGKYHRHGHIKGCFGAGQGWQIFAIRDPARFARYQDAEIFPAGRR